MAISLACARLVRMRTKRPGETDESKCGEFLGHGPWFWPPQPCYMRRYPVFMSHPRIHVQAVTDALKPNRGPALGENKRTLSETARDKSTLDNAAPRKRRGLGKARHVFAVARTGKPDGVHRFFGRRRGSWRGRRLVRWQSRAACPQVLPDEESPEHARKGHVLVRFFGTNDLAAVPTSRIEPYAAMRDVFKEDKRATKQKKFKEAMEAADAYVPPQQPKELHDGSRWPAILAHHPSSIPSARTKLTKLQPSFCRAPAEARSHSASA